MTIPRGIRKTTGYRGEGAAALYLQRLGYFLVERNFFTRYGEIDLILRDKDTLVFVEVKTKNGVAWGSPEEMFTRYKWQKVRRMATVYMKGEERKCRIDMVAVEMNDNEVSQIRHYKNVSFS